MNEEEKKAICLLKALNNLEKKCKIEKVPYKSEIKKIRISLLPEDYGIFEILLNLIEKLQKENKELKKSKITYEDVRDIQEKNRNIVDNNYISKQIVKDNLIKYQEEYELLLEYQSGKESNKTKTLRGRIHMCQELLEGRK